MTHNFLQFNPGNANSLSDGEYTNNGQRQEGLPNTVTIAQSGLHNKMFFQVTTMATAIAQVLSDQGNNVSDSDLSGLVAAIAATFIVVPGLPPGYVAGPRPRYVSPSTVEIVAGYQCRDSVDDADIKFSSSKSVNLNTSGAGGLDVGVKASSTFYFLHAIRKSADDTVNGLFSLSPTAPTLTGGYDQHRLSGFGAVNAAGNLIPFLQFPGEYRYNVAYGTVNNLPTSIVNDHMISGNGDKDASMLVPHAITTAGILRVGFNTGSNFIAYIEPKNDTSKRLTWSLALGVSGPGGTAEHVVPTDANGIYNYNSNTGNVDNYIQVAGFKWNEGAL